LPRWWLQQLAPDSDWAEGRAAQRMPGTRREGPSIGPTHHSACAPAPPARRLRANQSHHRGPGSALIVGHVWDTGWCRHRAFKEPGLDERRPRLLWRMLLAMVWPIATRGPDRREGDQWDTGTEGHSPSWDAGRRTEIGPRADSRHLGKGPRTRPWDVSDGRDRLAGGISHRR